MDFIIITNNPLVREKMQERFSVDYRDVTYEQVLCVVRDYVHSGHKLLSHPLSGSVKPRETPYKSVMIAKKAGAMDFESLEIIENCMATCQKFKARYETLSERVKGDFQLVDYTLIDSAIPSATSF